MYLRLSAFNIHEACKVGLLPPFHRGETEVSSWGPVGALGTLQGQAACLFCCPAQSRLTSPLILSGLSSSWHALQNRSWNE